MNKSNSKRNELKILHVCEVAIGGICSYLNVVCFQSNEIENFIVAPEGHVSGISLTTTVSTFRRTGRNITSVMRFIRASMRGVEKECPDIVFFHSTFALLALIVIKLKRSRVKTIYCSHGWAASRYSNALKRVIVGKIEGYLCGLADVVINISEYDQNTAISSGYLGRHVLVENAVLDHQPIVRSDKFSNNSDVINLLFIGRFDQQKGLDLLLKSFHKAQKERSDLHLTLIGSPVIGDQGNMEIPPQTNIIGWVDPLELDDWYRSSDALIVPSRWEGFGLVVAEAFRNGTPVLCSDRGALPFLVRPNETGEIFPLDEKSITNTLIGIDKHTLKSQRAACRTTYEKRFAPLRFVKEISEIYAELTISQQE